MYVRRAVHEGPERISAARNVCFVRNLGFSRVYYNNGNSLPFFPIPFSRGYFGRGHDTTRIHASSLSFTGANQSIDSIFCGTDVLAPYGLPAGLFFSAAGRRQAQGTFRSTRKSGLTS